MNSHPPATPKKDFLFFLSNAPSSLIPVDQLALKRQEAIGASLFQERMLQKTDSDNDQVLSQYLKNTRTC